MNRIEYAMNDDNVTIVKKSDLPVCCPDFSDKVWDEHPRVYLELGKQHTEHACPYCGHLFKLEENEE